MKTKFIKGQRVKRLKDVFRVQSGVNPMMYGKIIKIYSDYESRFGPYPELYEVLWDGCVNSSKGYLPHGLDEE